jgi:transposase
MKTLLSSPTYAFVVGIDVSKESLDVCLIRVADKQFCYQKINNNMQGFQKMKVWLKTYGCELESGTLVCMEHTDPNARLSAGPDFIPEDLCIT